MEQKEINYGFWFWKEQLTLIISTIAIIIGYDLEKEEIDLIKEELRGTNDEKKHWGSYLFYGKEKRLLIQLAYDGEEGSDMIHIRIPAEGKFLIQLETLNLIQSILNDK